jgi:hypothetical protein
MAWQSVRLSRIYKAYRIPGVRRTPLFGLCSRYLPCVLAGGLGTNLRFYEFLYGTIREAIHFRFFHPISSIYPHNVEKLKTARQLDLTREPIAAVRMPAPFHLDSAFGQEVFVEGVEVGRFFAIQRDDAVNDRICRAAFQIAESIQDVEFRQMSRQ